MAIDEGCCSAGLGESGRKRDEKRTYPPQSHRFRIKFPKNLIWLCSTSIVAPSRRTSFATKLLKIILRIEDLPEPDFPISKTFFLAGLGLIGLIVEEALLDVWLSMSALDEGFWAGREVWECATKVHYSSV